MAALLKHYELRLDATDFTFVGRWVTPPFAARRFDTLFFWLMSRETESSIGEDAN